jgi:hypothetical protein
MIAAMPCCRSIRIFGYVTNETGDYLSHAAIRVQFFDASARVYPRPSITCKFTITDLVPGKSSEIGEKNLKEIQEHGPTRAGLIRLCPHCPPNQADRVVADLRDAI